MKNFKKLIEAAGLRQIVKDATKSTSKSATLIDHIITSEYTVNELTRNFPAISDHEIIGVEISFKEISYQATSMFNRNLSVEAVSEIINEHIGVTIYTATGVNIIYSGYDEYYPGCS